MEKLKTMDESGNRPSADKIDQLMENLVRNDRPSDMLCLKTCLASHAWETHNK